jgi:hypothetical protein
VKTVLGVAGRHWTAGSMFEYVIYMDGKKLFKKSKVCAILIVFRKSALVLNTRAPSLIQSLSDRRCLNRKKGNRMERDPSVNGLQTGASINPKK